MRVAVLTLSDPLGPRSGATLRWKSLAEAIDRAGHEVHLVFPRSATEVPSSSSVGVGASAGERLLRGAAGRAKRHLLPMPTNLGGRNPHIVAELQRLRPDVLVVSVLSQVQFHEAVPDARLWFDFLDLWSSFATGEMQRRRGLARMTTRLQSRFLARQETHVATSADVVTAVGWRDASELTDRGGRPTWLPVTVGPDLALRDRSVERRGRAGMLANFHYWPNVDAYERLARDWAPRLRENGISCVVAGLGSSELPTRSGVEILGPVDELASFYDAVDFTCAPVVLGGGMKVKVVESLMRGVPVCGSPHAVEGLPADVADLVQVADLESPDFSSAADAVLDPERLTVLQPFTEAYLDETVTKLFRTLGEP